MFSGENRELTTPKSYVRHNEDTTSQSRSHWLESNYIYSMVLVSTVSGLLGCKGTIEKGEEPFYIAEYSSG